MNDEGFTKPGPAPRRYRRHWVTLVQPVMIAAIGLGLLKISTEFYHSAVGIGFIVAALRRDRVGGRASRPILGVAGARARW